MYNILDKIKDRIKKSEGCKLTAYRDTRGYLTIGWGHKVVDGDGIFEGDTITQERADDLFLHDFVWLLSGIKQLVPDFDKMPEGIQIALCDMGYNNGINGLKLFKKFLHYVNMGDKEHAADQIVDSDNFRSHDLHDRYVELETLVRSA